MNKFIQHQGVVAPMLVDNIDTDQIIPSREMKRASRDGLGDGLFANWRFEYDGVERTGVREDFVLNLPEYGGASILLGGKNFGCGSSREHAVWALCDFGIRVVIAESFGRIFQGNCARNGLLAIELTGEQIESISKAPRLLVDLEQNEVRVPDGDSFSFDLAQADRHMLLNGLDHIEYTQQFDETIREFAGRDREQRPWAYLD